MIGSSAGVCPIHKIERMYVGLDDNLSPTCVKCDAAAKPKMGVPQTAHDPGEGFFSGKGAVQAPPATATVPLATTSVTADTFDGHIQKAITHLKASPMPNDIKMFKGLQKAIKALENLLENENGR